MSMDRLFIALPLVEEQRSLLLRQQKLLQDTISFQKWTHPQDLHITLKFLGDTPANLSEQLPPLLREATTSQQPFILTLSGLGTFGKPDSPSILWAGVQGEMEPLRALQQKVELALKSLGFEPESRGYNPHITLARRYKGTASFNSGSIVSNNAIDAEKSSWTVNQLTLYRTHIGSKPMYEPVSEYAFA